MESDREIECPSKRRRQDTNFLCISDEESNYSISRSSSLLQFETLEKQCQDLSSSSPSILSSFSYDSLEHRKNLDSLDNDYYRTLKIEKAANMRDTFLFEKQSNLHDALLYRNVNSSDSEDTLNTSGSSLKQFYSFDDLQKIDKSDNTLLFNEAALKKSFCSLDDLSTEKSNREKKKDCPECVSKDELQSWRSFETLNASTNHATQKTKDKISAENLSEDSGYSDHFCVKNSKKDDFRMVSKEKPGGVPSDFDAYDCDVHYGFNNNNFGVSYHDLRVIDRQFVSRVKNVAFRRTTDAARSINTEEEFSSINNDGALSSSEPNLLRTSPDDRSTNGRRRYVKNGETSQYLENENGASSSVPKDLNLLCATTEAWNFNCARDVHSIAAKNLDLADAFLKKPEMAERKARRYGPERPKSTAERIYIPLKGRDSSSPETDATPNFKREGEYSIRKTI